MSLDIPSYLLGRQSGGGGGGGSSSLSGLTDVDISNPTDGQTLIYNSTSGKWENGPGGGLPAPTAADVGAGLAVVKTDVESEQVLVPEQTVIVPEGESADLTGVVSSLVAEGVQCRAVVNGEEFTGTIDSDLYLEGVNAYFNFSDNLFGASTDGSFTVAVYATVVTPTYSWQPELYTGYDVVIKLDDAGNELSQLDDSKLHLMKGSYADAMAKVGRGQPISAFVYGIENYEDETYHEDETYYQQFHVLEMYADIGYHDAVEISIGRSPHLNSMVRNADNSGSVILYSATTTVPITLYLTESGLSILPPWS